MICPASAVGAAADGIGAGTIGEGEFDLGAVVALVGATRGIGVAKAVVELDGVGAGNVDADALECNSTLLVLVEPVVDEALQHAPTLRRAVRDDMTDAAAQRVGCVGVVAQESNHITRDGVADTADIGVPSLVGQFVGGA